MAGECQPQMCSQMLERVQISHLFICSISLYSEKFSECSIFAGIDLVSLCENHLLLSSFSLYSWPEVLLYSHNYIYKYHLSSSSSSHRSQHINVCQSFEMKIWRKGSYFHKFNYSWVRSWHLSFNCKMEEFTNQMWRAVFSMTGKVHVN